ncbi:MAG: hypothetical protein SVV80_11335 [Planctomycetota bacterium]|nr:hypothetical protein [Planctomycetota bacterium]
MKRSTAYYLALTGIFVLALLVTTEPLCGQMLPTAKYEGVWEIRANGDVKVTRTFKLPMQLYRMWKSADMHMLEFRNFASGRSSVEVTDKKADWDDVNRTLTLTMTVLGLAENMSDHWQAKVVSGEEFSNLDEVRKIAYFHFSPDGPMGRVQGQDRIILPSDCTSPVWNPLSRALTYSMPEIFVADAGGSSKTLWWVVFVACTLSGAGMWAVSFVAGGDGNKQDS